MQEVIKQAKFQKLDYESLDKCVIALIEFRKFHDTYKKPSNPALDEEEFKKFRPLMNRLIEKGTFKREILKFF